MMLGYKDGVWSLCSWQEHGLVAPTDFQCMSTMSDSIQRQRPYSLMSGSSGTGAMDKILGCITTMDD